LPYFPDAHIFIAKDVRRWGIRICKSVVLKVACSLDALANRLAGFAKAISAEFFIVGSGEFDRNVNG
jgi:hypothetical protein